MQLKESEIASPGCSTCVHLWLIVIRLTQNNLNLNKILPDSTSRVNGGGSEQIWIDFVPIERSEGRTEVRIFVVI